MQCVFVVFPDHTHLLFFAFDLATKYSPNNASQLQRQAIVKDFCNIFLKEYLLEAKIAPSSFTQEWSIPFHSFHHSSWWMQCNGMGYAWVTEDEIAPKNWN